MLCVWRIVKAEVIDGAHKLCYGRRDFFLCLLKQPWGGSYGRRNFLLCLLKQPWGGSCAECILQRQGLLLLPGTSATVMEDGNTSDLKPWKHSGNMRSGVPCCLLAHFFTPKASSSYRCVNNHVIITRDIISTPDAQNHHPLDRTAHVPPLSP